MAFENTITEQDMDAASRSMVKGLRAESADFEPDLAVDGLSDSILARLLRLFRLACQQALPYAQAHREQQWPYAPA